jgi:hypothetical protein
MRSTGTTSRRRLATWINWRAATPVLAAAALACWPGAAVFGQIPEGWEVVRVTNDSFYDGPPAINCMGQVVWSKRINNDFDREEIFLYDIDGTVRRITDDNVRDAFPDINDDGVIVWSREVGPGGTLEIARYEDGKITILTDNEYTENGPRINNKGHVAWHQHWYRGCTEAAIFFYDGARIQHITWDGFSNQGVSINDSDELAWTRYDFCQNPWHGTPMYRKANGEIIQLTGGTDQSQVVHINNASQIVWGASPDGVAYWEKGLSRLLTDWGAPSGINSQGLIAFYRWHEDVEDWQQWLWVEEKEFRVSNDLYWNVDGELNDWGELTWEARTGARLADMEILLLTWRSDNADVVEDDSVDAEDYEALTRCLVGPEVRTEGCVCHRCDLDHDGDVDLRDYTHIQKSWGSGP